ncbi:MAG: periplasmic heavy metal sensor [Desulfamplus sp.]|nr:periplasmic heavy metal sensor [Desulfamplus sp.]
MVRKEHTMNEKGVNMRNKIFIGMAALFTLMVMVTNSFAWDSGYGRRGKGMGGQVGCQGQDFAKLTDDQKNKLKALHQKFIDETATQRASITSKHQEIMILMETTSPDKAKLLTLSSEITELKKQLMDKKIDLALEAKKIAPEIDLPIGGQGFGKRGMGGCSMMGDNDGDGCNCDGCCCKGDRGCCMMGNGNGCRMMMGSHGMMGGRGGCGRMMMDKGMGGKMNCPAMSSMPDDTESKSVEKDSKKN